jgi:hypothetical protein
MKTTQKPHPTINAIKAVACSIAIAALSACGGGGGASPAPVAQSTLSGAVVDGYIRGATVCLDFNKNNVCDSSEPTGQTGTNGKYSLQYDSTAVIENIPVLVNVPAGAVDESDGAIAKAYTLKGLATSPLVISPFTTLAMYKIEFTPGMTYGQAAQAVADSLLAQGASLDLSQDFIAQSNTALQNAARATVAMLQSSALNANPSSTNLDAFLIAASAPTQYGYSHPNASYGQMMLQVSAQLQSTLSVSTITPTNTSFVASPTALAADKSNNIYVVDGTRVLKTNAATGATSVYASGFTTPTSLAFDSQGNLYGTDRNAIFKVTANGTVSTFAGSTAEGSADGTLQTALFKSPASVTVGSDGFMYVADTGNNAIRKIDMVSGDVSTLPIPASLTANYTAPDTPTSIVATANGIYFAGSHGIYRWDGAQLLAYLFSNVTFVGGIAADAAGGIYFTDIFRAKVFKLLNSPILSSTGSAFITAQIAGSGTTGSVDGAASSASFAWPMYGIAIGSDGSIFVSDSGNRKIRTIK